MPAIEPELLERLKTLRAQAYAPYSDHPVAAVVETPDGHRFGGTNVEVAHFKSTCAEASALSSLVASGQRRIARVVVLGPANRACPPCGDCRQRLREFGAPDLRVLSVDDDGTILFDQSLDALLPHSFGPDHLQTG